MVKVRVFGAVEVPIAVRTSLAEAIAPLRDEAPDARWTDPADWHLTLAFLGWVSPERVEPAVEALRAAAGPGAFRLRFDGRVGTFGRRVLWAGLEPSEAVAGLAAALSTAFAAAGFSLEDRAFHPHLTLARAPRGTRLPRGLGDGWQGPRPEWVVDRAVLMRSRLGRSSPRYEVIAAVPLDPA